MTDPSPTPVEIDALVRLAMAYAAAEISCVQSDRDQYAKRADKPALPWKRLFQPIYDENRDVE